jgi:hypothetical protein
MGYGEVIVPGHNDLEGVRGVGVYLFYVYLWDIERSLYLDTTTWRGSEE